MAFGKRGKVIGFDINKAKIAELQKGFDRTGEVSAADLKAAHVQYTSEPTDLKGTDFFIVAVPTPINEALQPDLNALRIVSELIGENMSPGTIVVYESTVYPGKNFRKFHFVPAASKTDLVSIPSRRKMRASSFINAMFRSRCVFSITLAASATVGARSDRTAGGCGH